MDDGFANPSAHHLEAALEGNAALQEKIALMLERVESSLKDNRQHQEELRQLIDECAQNEKGPVPRPVRMQRFAMPYFKDACHSRPAENDELIWMRENGDVNACLKDERLWLVREQKCLERGVKSQCLEVLLRPFQEELEQLERRKRNNLVDDLEMVEERERELTAEIEQIADRDTAELEVDINELNWDRIQTAYAPTRTAVDCFIQWTNVLHPMINKGKWTKDEEKRLLALAREHKQCNWHKIAAELGTGRTPFQCLEHYQQNLNSDFFKSVWEKEDDERLREAIQYHGESSWCAVADYVGNKKQLSCLHRWLKAINPRLRKGHWTPEEDEELKASVQLFGDQWCRVATLVKGRSDAQCRERWKNILDPNLSQAPWTEEENTRLLQLVAERKGEKKIWSKIAEKLGTSRTDNHCYRHWLGLASDAERIEHFKNSVRRQSLPAGAKGTSLTVDDVGDEEFPEGVQDILSKGKKSWYFAPGKRKRQPKKKRRKRSRPPKPRLENVHIVQPAKIVAKLPSTEERSKPVKKKPAKHAKPAKPKRPFVPPLQSEVNITSTEDMVKHLKQVLQVAPSYRQGQQVCQLAPLPPSAATLRGLRRLFQQKPKLSAPVADHRPPTPSLSVAPSGAPTSSVCRWTESVGPVPPTLPQTIIVNDDIPTVTSAQPSEESNVSVEVYVERLNGPPIHVNAESPATVTPRAASPVTFKDTSKSLPLTNPSSQASTKLPLDSQEFQMLEERFVSLFQWPGLLSCIPLETKSQARAT